MRLDAVVANEINEHSRKIVYYLGDFNFYSIESFQTLLFELDDPRPNPKSTTRDLISLLEARRNRAISKLMRPHPARRICLSGIPQPLCRKRGACAGPFRADY